MKTILWILTLAATSALAVVLWLKWANAPLDRLMFAPRTSVEIQQRFITSGFPHRLTNAKQAGQSNDIYSKWAINESEARSIGLAAAWAVVSTLGLVQMVKKQGAS